MLRINQVFQPKTAQNKGVFFFPENHDLQVSGAALDFL